MGTFGIVFLIFWMLTLSVLIGVFVNKILLKKSGKAATAIEFNDIASSIGMNDDDVEKIRLLTKNAGIDKPYFIFTNSVTLEKVITANLNIIQKQKISPAEKDKKVAEIFEIKRKVINHFNDMRGGIKNTMEIESNQNLTLDVAGVGKFYSYVLMNDKKNLIIAMPDLKDPKSVPWKNKDVEVYFWRSNDAGYTFITKIEDMVYSKKLKALVIGHQEKINRVQKREFPRRKARFNAKFFKFKVAKNEKGKPVVLLGKIHFGIITDISPTGASLASDDALSAHSSVKLEVTMGEENEYLITVYCTIIKVVKRKNMYIMNIQFQRISDKSRNIIYKYVYQYI